MRVAWLNELLNHVGSLTNTHIAKVLLRMSDILNEQIDWFVVVRWQLWLGERVCLNLAG